MVPSQGIDVLLEGTIRNIESFCNRNYDGDDEQRRRSSKDLHLDVSNNLDYALFIRWY
jgi:hypothetical protein